MLKLGSPLTAAACLALMIPAPLLAQASAPLSQPVEATLDAEEPGATDGGTSSGDIIVIADPDGSYRISADRMHDMIEAYRKNRDRFAPQSSLFMRFRASSGASTEGITVRLRRGEEEMTLDVDASGTATIPVAMLGDGRWQLVVSRALGTLRITPTIYSPGTAIANRRMGDLRLQCRTHYGFIQNQVNIALRGLFNLFGGCSSSRFAIYYRADQPLASAMVEGRAEPLQLGRTGDTYRVPLSDRNISNEARLTLTYRN